MGAAISQFFISLVKVLGLVNRTVDIADKSVTLVENEVDNLAVMQEQRFANNKALLEQAEQSAK